MRSIGQSVQKLSVGNRDRYMDTQTHRQTHRHTDRHTDMCKTFTYPLLRAVNIDHNNVMTLRKKAPLCPKLSRMAAFLQGTEPGQMAALQPCHLLLFTFSGRQCSQHCLIYLLNCPIDSIRNKWWMSKEVICIFHISSICSICVWIYQI